MNDLLAKLRRPMGFVVATAAAAFITATVTVWVNSRAESDPPPPDREPALLTVAQYNFSENNVMWVLPDELPSGAVGQVEEATLFDNWESRRAEFDAVLGEHDGVRIESFFEDFVPTLQFTPVELVVTGNHDTSVLIRELRARVIKREDPLGGTLFYGPPEGVGEVIDVGLDLDAIEPVAGFVDEAKIEAGEELDPYFAENFITLKRGESTQFGIIAYTDECYCEWEIVVDAVVDGDNESFTVRDESQPFRTTAFASSYSRAYSTYSENPQGRVFGPMPEDWSPLTQ